MRCIKSPLLFAVFIQLFIQNDGFVMDDEHLYLKQRSNIDQLKNIHTNNMSLNAEETVVDFYLQILKSQEFTLNSTNYHTLEKHLEQIQSTELYKLLRKLPKGGNLHLHDFQSLDKVILLESIKKTPAYDLLYICDQDICGDCKYCLNYFLLKPNQGWTHVKSSNWTIVDIVKKTTFMSMLNALKEPLHASDTVARWKLARKAFYYYNEICEYNETLFVFFNALFEKMQSENVQLVESRSFLLSITRPWYFSSKGEKVYMDSKEVFTALDNMRKQYLNDHPEFIDSVLIITSLRNVPAIDIERDLNQTIDFHQLYPELITGYDLVGEEDLGYSLFYHRNGLIDTFNKIKTNTKNFNFFFHTAETNWPDDVAPYESADDIGTLNNLFDSLLFQPRRIGHGIGLFKYPSLYKFIQEKQIAIEICPSSNNLLGYVPDLRNHPGINYYRSGLPIVLGGDDPGTFGYNEFTLEFYIVFVMWGFSLKDLKQLAWNSIHYSSISDERKSYGFKVWSAEWDKFIHTTYDYACNQSFNSPMKLSNSYPSYGFSDSSTNVTIHGIGFENTLCKSVVCKFGQYETIANVISVYKIICPSPILHASNETLLPISLKINEMVYDTNFTFKVYPKTQKIYSRKRNALIFSNCFKVSSNENLMLAAIVGIYILTFFSF